MTLSLQDSGPALFIGTPYKSIVQRAFTIVRKKNQNAPVGGVFWYPETPVPDSCQFGIINAPYLNKLTWGDVSNILEALISYYSRTSRPMNGISFLIEDHDRGALGSGVVKAVVDPQNGGDRGSTTTA